MKDWLIPSLTGVFTLLGALLAGGFALVVAWTQMSRQDRRERRKLILDKLEALHQVISDYSSACESIVSRAGQRDENAKFPEVDDLWKLVPTQKIRMLTGFYAADLESYLDDIEKSRRLLDSRLRQWRDARTKPGDSKKALDDLQIQNVYLNEKCKQFQQEVVRISKRYI
jgi:hypothetical protein